MKKLEIIKDISKDLFKGFIFATICSLALLALNFVQYVIFLNDSALEWTTFITGVVTFCVGSMLLSGLVYVISIILSKNCS